MSRALASLVAAETRTVSVQMESDGSPVTVDYRIRRPTALESGRLFGIPAEAGAPVTGDPVERAKVALAASLPLICASVTHVRIAGGEWESVRLVMEPTEDPDDLLVTCLGTARIVALAAGVTTLIGEGGEALASFLGRGVGHP